MRENITISRYVFIAICLLLAVLVIALFITWAKAREKEKPPVEDKPDTAWLQDGTNVPIGLELKTFLTSENVYSLVLFREDGRFRWVDPNGKEFDICGKVVRGKIEGCGLEDKKVTLTKFAEITVLGTTGSDCVLGIHQGKIAWIHSNPRKMGHTYPCH